MNCAEIEVLICDYVDGTLAPDQKSALERHLSACPACAELARDSAAAVAFIERAADVEPPPELITRILFDAPWTKGKPDSRARRWLSALLGPVLTPRYAMGMAMTVLSLSMLAKFVGPVRPIQMSDLRPSQVLAGVEDRAARAWARTVKFYDSLKVVYQIQSALREWQQEDEAVRPVKTDEHKLAIPERRILNTVRVWSVRTYLPDWRSSSAGSRA